MCAIQDNGQYYIEATSRMMDRPLANLLEPLEKLGMKVSYHNKNHSMPLTITADALTGNKIQVDGNKSSQFASGLLMTGLLMKDGLIVESVTNHKQPYLEMTAKVMAEFGAEVSIDDNTYEVSKSHYISSNKYTVEPDASTVSYFGLWQLLQIQK